MGGSCMAGPGFSSTAFFPDGEGTGACMRARNSCGHFAR